MNHGERMFWVLIILRLPQTRHGGRRRFLQQLSKRCFCQSDRQFQLHWMCRRLFRSICWLCGVRSVCFRLWRSRKRPSLMFSLWTRILYAFPSRNKMLALWQEPNYLGTWSQRRVPMPMCWREIHVWRRLGDGWLHGMSCRLGLWWG